LDLVKLVEAVLFSADEPVSLTKLATAFGVGEEKVLDTVSKLEEEYKDRAICIERVMGGFQIVTRPEYAQYIQKIFSRKVSMSLSKGALETLAIIAYRQPVTRQDIEAIRGVNTEASLDTLLEKGLIKEVGRKKTLGRPKLYGTTDEFLKKASLNSISDLPPLKPCEGKIQNPRT